MLFLSNSLRLSPSVVSTDHVTLVRCMNNDVGALWYSPSDVCGGHDVELAQMIADASLLAHAMGNCNKKQRRGCRASSRQSHHGTFTLIRFGRGECSMSVVLTDLLLFICVAVFLTGIMIAGAILVG